MVNFYDEEVNCQNYIDKGYSFRIYFSELTNYTYLPLDDCTDEIVEFHEDDVYRPINMSIFSISNANTSEKLKNIAVDSEKRYLFGIECYTCKALVGLIYTDFYMNDNEIKPFAITRCLFIDKSILFNHLNF